MTGSESERRRFRKRPDAAAALTKDELLERLNEAQRNAQIGSWSWDLRTDVVWWSDELYRIFELDPATFTPTVSANAEYVHPEDRDAYHEAVARVVAGDGVLDYELRIVAASGAVKHCRSRGQIERDAAGTPMRLFGTFHDVTQRRLAEITLQASEERYRQIVETAQEGVWQIDARGVTTFVNARMAEMLGYARDEMIGASLFDFMDEEGRALAERQLERRRQGLAGQHDFVFRRKDGSEVWTLVGANAIHDAEGAYAGAFAMVTDITEKERALAALRVSDARFRQLAESLPSLVLTCSLDGVCDYVNRRWREYVDEDAASGSPWLNLVHPEDRGRVLADWTRAIAQETEFRSELRLRRRDGVHRWFEFRATPLMEKAGARACRWIGSATDVDERRRAQELQLRTQKMEALGTLAGGVAHDFNNILLAISGNARLALADLPEHHAARTSVLEIERAGARAADLVRRILTFSRQEEPRREVISLQDVAAEALKLLRSTLPSMIELRVRLAAEAPNVVADATQVHQVVMNLCANAAHAIGARAGVIEVRLESVRVDAGLARTVAGLREGPHARLSVMDNGCGMTPETLERIFDPFFTTKRVGEGTGLGLSVVAGIMQSHGGAITARSSPGAGSTFDAYFPACSAEADATAPVTREPSRGRGETVMYVDDDEALVRLTVRMLERMGYRVRGFVEPEAALAWFTTHRDEIDLAVTDLSMPRMSGFDLARMLLALRTDLPVVVTSGYVRQEDQDAAASIGVRALLLKPDTIDALGRALDELLGRARSVHS